MRLILVDQNFNRKVLRGVLKDAPDLVVFRPKQFELQELEDPDLLAWTAESNAILITHDYSILCIAAHPSWLAYVWLSFGPSNGIHSTND